MKSKSTRLRLLNAKSLAAIIFILANIFLFQNCGKGFQSQSLDGLQFASKTGLNAAQIDLKILPVSQDQISYIGEARVLSVFASSAQTDQISYQWKKDGVLLPGQIGPDLVISNLNEAKQGAYSVVVTARPTDSKLAPNEQEIRISDLKVAPVPGAAIPISVESQSLSQALTSGSATFLQVKYVAYPTASVQWSKDGVVIPGANRDILFLSEASSQTSGIYSAKISNSNGAAVSKEILILVDRTPEPPVVRQVTSDQQLAAGQTLTLSIQTVSVGETTYAWYKDGQLLSGLTGPELKKTNLTAAESGLYKVIAQNAAGAVFKEIQVRVTEQIQVTKALESKYTALNADVEFSSSFKGTIESIQWFKNDVLLTGQNQNSLRLQNVQSSDDGVYKIRVRNSLATVEQSATLHVVPAPSLVKGLVDQNILIGEKPISLKLEADFAGEGLTYQWYFKAIGANAFVAITGTTAASYSKPSLSLNDAGTYEVRAVNISGTASSSAALLVKEAPKTCSFNGQTLAHGASVSAYAASNVSFGQTCQTQSRVCTNGVLSGNYAFSSCTTGGPASCLFNGQTLAHGETAMAFTTASVAFGQSCQSEARTCNNGSLSGSASYPTCTPAAAATCNFNGQTIAHGYDVTAYAAASVPYGQACVAQVRRCNNGELSGQNAFSICQVGPARDCILADGQLVPNGSSILMFQSSSVPYNEACSSQTRICTNGILSGSFTAPSCTVSTPPVTPTHASCEFQGRLIAHGSTISAYAQSSVAYGQNCTEEKRLCFNGALSGSYTNESCFQAPPNNCVINGRTISNGATVTAYQMSDVSFDQPCRSQTRTCQNGTLSGSYGYDTCSVRAPAACAFNGQSVPHGAVVAAFMTLSTYKDGIVTTECRREDRLCMNGLLSGSASDTACHY